MERLTGKDARSLMEAYTAVHNIEVKKELNEEEQLKEFLQTVNKLIEDGYDLSQYTYDELYEHYLSEGGLGTVLKSLGGRALTAARGAARTAWKGTVKQTEKGIENIPGAKQSAKEILARAGKVAPWVGLAAGLDQALLGGGLRQKGGEWIGAGLQQARQGVRSIPSPGQSQLPATASQPSQPKPEDKKKSEWEKLKESNDLFDLVKDYLLNEGYASTEDKAIVIMANMSQSWKNNIIENITKN